jgi:hypothetical protein
MMSNWTRTSDWRGTRPAALDKLVALALLLPPLSCGSSSPAGPGNAGRSLGPAAHYSSNGIWVGKTAIADLNGDGRNDVVTIESTNSPQRMLIYYQNAAGMLDPPTVISPPDLLVRSVAVGDLNHDGKADLAVSGNAISASSGWLGRVLVYYQDPASGTLSLGKVDTVSSNNVGDVAIGDLNADGRNDLVVAAEWTVRPGQGRLSIRYQRQDGTLGPESLYDNVGVIPWEVRVADVTGDGRNDIIVQNGLLTFAVIRQNADGTLNASPDTYAVKTSYWPTFYSFAVGDVNADGRNDVVVLDPGNNGYLNVFLQSAQGTLVRTLPDTLTDTPYGIQIADINGDGLNDLLADQTFPSVPTAFGEVLVFHQHADHTFAAPTRYTFPTLSGGGSSVHQALSIGDVTGDGWPDAVMTWGNEGLWVLPNVAK